MNLMDFFGSTRVSWTWATYRGRIPPTTTKDFSKLGNEAEFKRKPFRMQQLACSSFNNLANICSQAFFKEKILPPFSWHEN